MDNDNGTGPYGKLFPEYIGEPESRKDPAEMGRELGSSYGKRVGEELKKLEPESKPTSDDEIRKRIRTYLQDLQEKGNGIPNPQTAYKELELEGVVEFERFSSIYREVKEELYSAPGTPTTGEEPEAGRVEADQEKEAAESTEKAPEAPEESYEDIADKLRELRERFEKKWEGKYGN